MIAKQSTSDKESPTVSKEHKSTKSAQKVLEGIKHTKEMVRAVDNLAGRNNIHSPRGPYSKDTEIKNLERQLETEGVEASNKRRSMAKKTAIEEGKERTREDRIERHKT